MILSGEELKLTTTPASSVIWNFEFWNWDLFLQEEINVTDKRMNEQNNTNI